MHFRRRRNGGAGWLRRFVQSSRLMQQLQVTCVPRRHRHAMLRRDWHVRRRLAVRHRHGLGHHHRRGLGRHHRCYVELLRQVRYAVRWHGRMKPALRWDALHQDGRPPRCYGPEHRRRRALPGRRRVLPRLRRRVQSYCDWPRRRRRRDIFRRRPRRSDGCPSRGHSPSRPMAPCPGRCRYRNTPARKSPWERRHRARSRSSPRNRPVECQY